MSGITFRLPEGGRKALWGVFAAANAGAVVLLRLWEAIPLILAMLAVVAWHAHRRRSALQELQRAARDRQLVRDASHQLRTHLTVARGHAEFILEAHPYSPGAGDVAIIAGELRRLSTISSRLLMFFATEDANSLKLYPVDIRTLVESTVTRWTAVAPRRWHSWVTGASTALLDRERIECALDALIENAVGATEEGDVIAVVATVHAHVTIIDVVDEGSGIRGDLARIFDGSSGVGSNGRRRNGRTGLGLPMVKAIAEAHGGSVGVWSERGKGTTFRLRLNGGPAAARSNQDRANR